MEEIGAAKLDTYVRAKSATATDIVDHQVHGPLGQDRVTFEASDRHARVFRVYDTSQDLSLASTSQTRQTLSISLSPILVRSPILISFAKLFDSFKRKHFKKASLSTLLTKVSACKM
jgi:hypothetical protein